MQINEIKSINLSAVFTSVVFSPSWKKIVNHYSCLTVLVFVIAFAASMPARTQEFYGTPGIAAQSSVVSFPEIDAYAAMALDVQFESEVITPFMPIPSELPVPEDIILYSNELAPSVGDVPEPMVPSPGPSASFLALGDAGTSIPPDTHGAVGPNHLMVTLNTQVRIQDRTGGVISTVTLNSFWSSLSSPSAFDPKVLYDPYNNRWIFTACANQQSAASSLLIGVSQTSNPTGAWNLYRVDADAADTVWADYPSIGFNMNWIVVQTNMFAVSNNSFVRSNIYVFDKVNLYSGGAGNYTLITNNAIGGVQAPAITYDNTLSTMYLVQTWSGNSGGNGILRIHTITGAVGSEVLTLGPLVSTPNPWSSQGNVGNADFAPQLGSSNKIMNNDDRMQNCVYRNDFLWCAHTVFLPASSATRSAVQWWQFTTSGTVQQRGRMDDPTGATFYAFPTIAVNKANHAMIGYSRYSASQYASGNYAFRSAFDSLSTLRDDTVLKAGEAPYYKTFSGTRNRWGDYSNTVVDPVNDADMWTIQEYAATPSGGSDRWGTWWGKIKLSFNVSGYVLTSGAAGIPGVTMSGLPGTPITDATGFYSTSVDFGWSGTVTPGKSGYTFSPSSTPYTNVTSDQSQNYTGTPVDNTPPTVTSIVRKTPLGQYYNGSSMVWTVNFSEMIDATTVSIADFTLTDVNSSITGESITSVSPTTGTVTAFDVICNTGTGNGTLRLDVLGATATINDLAGNDITANFTTGETYIFSTITGNVTLEDWAAPSSVTLLFTVEYHKSGTLDPLTVVNMNLLVTPGGGMGTASFSLMGLPLDTYDIWVKCTHWLAKMTPNINVLVNPNISNVTLINGDVVVNNEVDFSDINAVRAAYGSFPGDETWNEMADVDGSGEVDFTDINIVRSNYGTIGD